MCSIPFAEAPVSVACCRILFYFDKRFPSLHWLSTFSLRSQWETHFFFVSSMYHLKYRHAHYLDDANQVMDSIN